MWKEQWLVDLSVYRLVGLKEEGLIPAGEWQTFGTNLRHGGVEKKRREKSCCFRLLLLLFLL